MITSFSHGCVYVLDQDRALAFYRDTLGFEVRMDFKTDGGYRWLTVGPKTQPTMSLILSAIQPGWGITAEHATMLRELVGAGALGVGMLEVDDCRATTRELKAKGARFKSEPAERPYGIEAVLVDDSGNWFSMVERRR